MIFPIGLKVLGQVLDPARKKRDLHICAAGIFLMQLELLETRRLVTLCHNEGANLDEEPVLATAHLLRPYGIGAFRKQLAFAFAVVPQMQFCA